MRFSEFLDNPTLDRRMTRGAKAWRKFFSAAFWNEVALFLLFIILLIPYVIPTYVVGWFCEWRDNRKAGIKTVKP